MLENIVGISTKMDFDNINCYEIVKCIFNLNNTDLVVLQSFNKNDGMTINQLKSKIEKDRSIIYRSLEKLITCKLCYKERKSGEKRGFIDYYYRIPIKEIFKITEENLDKCYLKIKKLINDMDKDV
jgi:predicted transcriptional regulator